jgi:hypothetical protein
LNVVGVTGSPSLKVASSRRVKVHTVESSLVSHSVATAGTSSFWLSTAVRLS